MILEQFRISDFLEWHKNKQLKLNPEFQRGEVWTPAARVYLIDTVLRQLPMPKIYLRTRVDLKTKQSIREVVDGQQRLRAIIDFANDRFVLSKRAEEFEGLRYSSLNDELQERFLSYPIAVGQLLNATDDDVLEIFSRLNSYNVVLNPAERRHAQFSGDFKWAVHKASQRWAILWDKFQVVSVRQRVRMLDDSLMAEMFGVLLEGVKDGGQPKIDVLYRRHDSDFDTGGQEVSNIDHVVKYFLNNIAEELIDTPIMNAPHFLMLFSALAHALVGIPAGDMNEDMPDQDPDALSEIGVATENLILLASIISSDAATPGFEEFWRASAQSTQRIASRRIRFPIYYRALLPRPLQ